MSLSTALYPINGTTCPDLDGFRPKTSIPSAVSDHTAAPFPAFGQIVALYQSNELLLSELQKVKKKQNDARAYLETPGSNPALGKACLIQLKARHSAVLTMLRANRIQAGRLLNEPRGGCDSISA